MNTHTTPELDPFEAALLSQLRSHVAERADHGPAPRRRPWRRYAVGVAAAAAVAAALVVTGPDGGSIVGPTPAYAVEVGDDGSVTATINRLDDPSGFQADLRRAGVEATVDFSELTRGSMTYNLPPAEDGAGTDLYTFGDSINDGPVTQGPCRSAVAAAAVTPVGEGWEVVIPAGSPMQDRSVWIITNPRVGMTIVYAGTRPGVYCSFDTPR